jgi:hypothetical protein
MNGTTLLQALMAAPEPKPGGSTIVIDPADGWQIPIHDAPHIRRAILSWPLYHFSTAEVRKDAAQRIVARAVRLGIVAEGLALVKK